MSNATSPRIPGSPLPYDRIVVVHGFGATVDDHWFPWLAETAGAERVSLPNPESPDADEWIALVTEAVGALSPTTAIVAHSLGGVTAVQAINRLHRDRPGQTLGAFVAVSPFRRPLPESGIELLDEFGRSGRRDRFLDGVDVEATARITGVRTVIRSDDDPIVPPTATDDFAAALGADIEVIPGAGHFLGVDGHTRLDAVLGALTH